MEWSRQAFGEFLDALPDAAIVIETQCERVVLANSRAVDLFGYPLRELRDMPLARLLPEDGRPDRGPQRAFSEQGGVPADGGSDRTLLRSNGQAFAADVAHRPITLDGRTLVVAMIRDVSDRRREEDELRKSEERLRQAVRVSEIGIFDHDHSTDTHYWSARQHEMYGWPADEPVTVPAFLQRLHEDDRQVIADGIRRAHDPVAKGSFDVEHRIIRSDGQVRWIATRSTTIFAGEGSERHAVRTVGASLDLTDRKHVEEGRERLAAILDATPDLVSISDPSGKLLYLNQSARAFLRIEGTNGLSNRRLGDQLPESTRELVLKTAIPAATRDGSWKGETVFLDSEGREVPFSVLLLAHKQTDGRISFLSTIARDLTKEKSLEAQFLHAQKLEAIGRLAGGVAHDFNNLLSVIMGSAELAARGLPPEHPSLVDIEEVKRASERAASLTRGMLAFSRKQVLRPRVVDVNEVLRGMVPMMGRLIGEHIEIATRLAPDLGRVKADPHHLEQVILNLVVNARDAMPSGGTLTLETQNAFFDERYAQLHLETKPGPYVMVAVVDTGIGMTAATQARIFEPFFTTKAPGQGTGLGLSMVFGIVKQSGGDVSVRSEIGRGTSIHLYFPLTEDGEPVVEAAATTPLAAGARGGRVLLVEDEARLRKLVDTILRRHGYEVLVAEGPVEALEIALNDPRPIDLLLTDIVMPQMSGTDLAEQIATFRPDIRVLLTSGYTDNILHEGIVDNGVHFLTKPFTPDVLLETVRHVLDGVARELP